jgi:predicted phage replisome organizer
MADIKWIKITTDMFEDEKIDFISTLPEADAIIVIWIRILTLAGKCNAGGYVLLTEKIPYTEEMLAQKFRKPLSVVRLALETFKRLEMMDMTDNVMFLPNWEKHQNVEAMEKVKEYERLRKAKQRDKKKMLSLEPPKSIVPDNVPDMSRPIVPDGPGNVRCIDIDIEKQKTYIPEFDDVKDIFEHWNKAGIIKHRELTQKMRSAINARLNSYTADELKEAINNYSSILKSDKHFFSYKWSMADFFNPENFIRFLTENDPYTNYLKEKPKTRADRTPSQIAVDREIAFNKYVAAGGNPDEFCHNVS